VKTLRIGTRGSRLALWQAQRVADLLSARGTPTTIAVIKTTGDRIQEAPLSDAGGKRLFVKEIEDALLQRDVDLAVHSAKDMPAVLPEGLDVAIALEREDPRDALVLARDRTKNGVRPASDPDWIAAEPQLAAALSRLGNAPTIATSSVRRAAQLAAFLPSATFVPIRGNVDTRLRKLDDGGPDAIVLALAGMRRLGVEDRVTTALPFEVCVPAPGQGIVAVEIRADDRDARDRLAGIHHAASGIALAAERALVVALGGGCQLPLGGVAVLEDHALVMHAVVASLDGRRVLRRSARGSAVDPEGLGHHVGAELIDAGAMEILKEVR
jgi:hydroxymethylbilane synthase